MTKKNFEECLKHVQLHAEAINAKLAKVGIDYSITVKINAYYKGNPSISLSNGRAYSKDDYEEIITLLTDAFRAMDSSYQDALTKWIED